MDSALADTLKANLKNAATEDARLDTLDFARQFTRDEIARNYNIDNARYGIP